MQKKNVPNVNGMWCKTTWSAYFLAAIMQVLTVLTSLGVKINFGLPKTKKVSQIHLFHVAS